MAGISIALTSLSDYTSVKVEGLGVIKVRKESSNQGLRSSENTRDMFRLQNDSKILDAKITKLIADGYSQDSPEVMELDEKATKNLEKITAIRKSQLDIKRSRLSDDEDGKLVDYLFEHASDADISKLFARAEMPEVDTQAETEEKTDE